MLSSNDKANESLPKMQPHRKKKKKLSVWAKEKDSEKERIKSFWLELTEDDRKQLVKLEKEAVLKKIKEQQRQSCSCNACGRKRRSVIEEELENLYDAYYDELETFASGTAAAIAAGDKAKKPVKNSKPLQYRNHHHLDSNHPNMNDFGSSLTVKGGILTLADDFLKNDGKKFLDLMEQLSSKTQRGNPSTQQNWSRPEFDDNDNEDDDVDEYSDNDDDDRDSLNEEQRMEEGRRMFQIFAAKMFEQRVLSAYREKAAKQCAEELLNEEEEKERQIQLKEEKKQKQKDKKNQKKRAVQQAKNDEKQLLDDLKRREEEAILLETQKKEEERQRKINEQLLKEAAEKQKREDDERIRKEAERIRNEENERRTREIEEKKRIQREKQKLKEAENLKVLNEKKRIEELKIFERRQKEDEERNRLIRETEALALEEIQRHEREKSDLEKSNQIQARTSMLDLNNVDQSPPIQNLSHLKLNNIRPEISSPQNTILLLPQQLISNVNSFQPAQFNQIHHPQLHQHIYDNQRQTRGPDFKNQYISTNQMTSQAPQATLHQFAQQSNFQQQQQQPQQYVPPLPPQQHFSQPMNTGMFATAHQPLQMPITQAHGGFNNVLSSISTTIAQQQANNFTNAFFAPQTNNVVETGSGLLGPIGVIGQRQNQFAQNYNFEDGLHILNSLSLNSTVQNSGYGGGSMHLGGDVLDRGGLVLSPLSPTSKAGFGQSSIWKNDVGGSSGWGDKVQLGPSF